jgi:hypothetical protein
MQMIGYLLAGLILGIFLGIIGIMIFVWSQAVEDELEGKDG